ncbi:P-loop containing nucleoside triphosphate hydrolase protein [Chaetomium fimeti]|uniref:ATP-dependent RNA helicase n=1 Tax=Chaetomium fimeti TaxID=1854472 RepID=A0AAE0LQC5_9PEZI|nr:P-loop containing nucleoside triphosphate hydrolase protein [Chaetomium fimeti]
MYNRYIPPTKEKQSRIRPQTTSAASDHPYGRSTRGQTPAEPSQRPPTQQPQRIVFDDADLPPIDDSNRKQSLDEEIASRAGDKKPKKSKSKKSKDDTEDGAIVAEREPKREKKKMRKREDKPDVEMVDGDDDRIRRRHKSVFDKVQKSLQTKDDVEDASEEEAAEPEVEHDLEPLPQPEPVIFDESKLTYETLPPWLASPVRVGPDITRPFTELGIAPESSKVLETKGLKDAFAVQTAVLPLLLPSPDRQGDVVVAAPTGSGKTLSYVLPMVHDVSKSRVTRLRALIVLPTRDLVQQVQLAFEACTAAFAVNGGKRVKIGTAMGNRVFKEEQSVIMGEEQRYDPEGYKRYLRKQDQIVSWGDSEDEEDDLELELKRTQPLPFHVIDHVFKVDILICTPGRLVEHIAKTRGFSLDYVRWLIVDEADKLLTQDFQQWLDIVMEKLSVEKPGARDFPTSNKSGVRKVILSATMTRDLSLLNGLKLSRPKLIVVEGTKPGEQNLPSLLKEFAIKIREPSLKPLYLVDLLHSKHMAAVNSDTADEATVESKISDSESSTSESSASESDSDSESDSSSSSDDDESDDELKPKTKQPTPTTTNKPTLPTTVLIFTKSNEAALRLSRLLALLSPDLAPLIGTLTSSTKTSRRARTLRAFAQGKLRVLVASDLVSRGIDLLNLEHVVNYDLPISETSYVHRVGRTARAGKRGCAWTLVEHAEARRFWREFAGEGKGAVTTIGREGLVERVRVGEGEFAEERVKAYEGALERLREEAAGGREGRR